jgi:CRISPR/Cas system type I-B associated protein Csh2 (Cas7 group RAMP superfamily)
MKIFVQTMEREKQAYAYLRNKFSKLIKAKAKVDIFIGPLTRDIMQDLY